MTIRVILTGPLARFLRRLTGKKEVFVASPQIEHSVPTSGVPSPQQVSSPTSSSLAPSSPIYLLPKTLEGPPASTVTPHRPLSSYSAPPTTAPIEEAPALIPASPDKEVRNAAAARSPVERTLVIGVDFGTSSTKVVWQDLSDDRFETFQWNAFETGLSRLLFPSALVIRGDKIHFGVPEREGDEGDVRLSSLKLCVLCRTNHSICRCGNAAARNGRIYSLRSGTSYPASALACLLLAYVFNAVERDLTQRFPDNDLFLIWNIGCPMDFMDETNRKREWEAIAGVAMGMRDVVSNPASPKLLDRIAADLDDFVIPPESERNYRIQPEGLAAVKAFLESPQADSKTYAIVDVGAGTTEVSFFFNGRIMTDPGHPLRPSYLADSTQPIGGRRIDFELGQTWNCSAEDARLKKESGTSTIPAIPTIGSICGQYDRTCCNVLQGRKLIAANDKRFDLFIIGGGGRLRPLHDALCRHPLRGGFVRERWQHLQPPRTFKDRLALQDDYDVLATACGLASSLSWDYYPPKDVSPMPAVPVITGPRRDIDEYYPK
jgi:hypothetical protein